MRTSVLVLSSLIGFTATAAVIDRVAVVVGKIVILESEVNQEMRLTSFLNGQPLAPNAQARREAAERLVDQQLIRNEMQIGHYPEPQAAEKDSVLQKFRKENYPDTAAYQAALQKYGITEDQLKQHLVWQLEVLHFTDVRFGPGMASALPARTPNGKTPPNANRTLPAETGGHATSLVPAQSGADTPEESADQQMDSWLKETRAQVRIQFKKEAFQ